MRRALVTALVPDRAGMLGYDNLAVRGLVGWAVLAASPEHVVPNDRIWAHLTDLDTLPRELREALG